jgi:hypothetical protein
MTFTIVLCGLLFAVCLVIAVLLLFRGVDKTLEQMDAIAPPVLPRPEPRIRPKPEPEAKPSAPVSVTKPAPSVAPLPPPSPKPEPTTSPIAPPPESKPEAPIALVPKPLPPPTPAPPTEPKIIERVVEVIKEVFVPAPTPPAIPPEAIKVRFTSAKGRLLAEDVLLPKQRRPCVKRNVDGVQSVFQCSHKDGETWVYRRQSVERE